MKILHLGLENKLEEKYTFKDVIEQPLKSADNEILKDLNYEELFSGSEKRKSRLNDLAILLSFGINSIPHEIIHAGTNILTGGTNKEIVINRLFGGDIVHFLYSGIDAKVLLPIIGGYVKVDKYGSALSELAVAIAPYALTPLGIYLVSEGKRKKSLSMAIAGSGMVITQIGGVIGDFLHFGRAIINDAIEITANSVGYQNVNTDNPWLNIPIFIGGFYIGTKAMSFSYRAFKSGVNYYRNKFTKNVVKYE